MHLPYKYFVALFYFTQEVILYLGCNFCSTDDFAYDIMNVFFCFKLHIAYSEDRYDHVPVFYTLYFIPFFCFIFALSSI